MVDVARQAAGKHRNRKRAQLRNHYVRYVAPNRFVKLWRRLADRAFPCKAVYADDHGKDFRGERNDDFWSGLESFLREAEDPLA